MLEAVFGLPPELRTTHVARGILFAHVAPKMEKANEGLDTAAWISEVWRRTEGLWTIENPADVVVRTVEERLEKIEVGGVPMKGFVDRVDDGPNGPEIADYKGLALDTPLPTPTGWTTMGAVEVGDELLGSDGRPTTVTIKSAVHHRPCFEIRFSDGSTVICDNVHLWTVNEMKGGQPALHDAVPTERLHEMFQAAKANGRPQSLVIPNAAPLKLDDAELLIDPWILGAWLGDGSSRTGEITIGKADIDAMTTLLRERWSGETRLQSPSQSGTVQATLTKARADLCPFGHDEFRKYSRSNHCMACLRIGRDASARWNNSLSYLLRKLDLVRNKHVPNDYLRGSLSQRLALLRGLMDTDGSWNEQRRRAVFVTTNARLADGVAELVLSLGVTAQRFQKPYSNTVRPDAVAYRVEFRPVGFNPFRLPRKAQLVDSSATQRRQSPARALRRAITDVRPVPSVPTQCVQVDASDSLYLCGPTMIPTHNPAKVKAPHRSGDDQGDQIRIYVAGYEAKHGERPARGRLLYTQHGVGRDVDLSPAAMTKTLDEFAGSWEITERLTEANRFPTKTGPLCGWCSYVKCCPTALAQGRGPSDRSKNPLLEIRPFAGGGNRPRPVHIGGDRPKENQPMTEELKPWVETYDNGVLNPNSYAAQAVYSLVTIATGELHKAGQPITGATVSALSETLGVVVRDVAAKLNVDASLQSGSHSRIRHALYTALETLPLPWGPDLDAWATWADALTRRTFGIAVAANKLHASLPGLDAAPFGVLAEHTKAPRKRNRRSTDPKPAESAPSPAPSTTEPAPAGSVDPAGVLVDNFDAAAG